MAAPAGEAMNGIAIVTGVPGTGETEVCRRLAATASPSSDRGRSSTWRLDHPTSDRYLSESGFPGACGPLLPGADSRRPGFSLGNRWEAPE